MNDYWTSKTWNYDHAERMQRARQDSLAATILRRRREERRARNAARRAARAEKRTDGYVAAPTASTRKILVRG